MSKDDDRVIAFDVETDPLAPKQPDPGTPEWAKMFSQSPMYNIAEFKTFEPFQGEVLELTPLGDLALKLISKNRPVDGELIEQIHQAFCDIPYVRADKVKDENMSALFPLYEENSKWYVRVKLDAQGYWTCLVSRGGFEGFSEIENSTSQRFQDHYCVSLPVLPHTAMNDVQRQTIILQLLSMGIMDAGIGIATETKRRACIVAAEKITADSFFRLR